MNRHIILEQVDKNSHIEKILEKLSSAGVDHGSVTAFSACMLEVLEDIVNAIHFPVLNDSRVFVAVEGKVALGLANLWDGTFAQQRVSEFGALYVNAVYHWVFSGQVGANPELDLRYMGQEFVAPLELIICCNRTAVLEMSDVVEEMQRQVSIHPLLPGLKCRVVSTDDLKPEDLVASYCLVGWPYFLECLEALEQKDRVEFSGAIESSANKIAHSHEGARRWRKRIIEETERAARGCLSGEDGRARALFITHPGFGVETAWYNRNAAFFKHIEDHDYDQLVVVDATKALGDFKGAEKNNQFTLNRVIGVQCGNRFIEAHNVVLKVRGITGFRDGIIHKLDLIKEFVVYEYLMQATANQLDFFVESGPLLLDFRNVNFPASIYHADYKVGLFMKQIRVPKGASVFTTRAIRITDFWSRAACLKRIDRDASQAGVKLNRQQVLSVIDEVASRLWFFGLSLDYADIAFMLDSKGNIIHYQLFDLERVSLGELTNEQHLLFETLIDLKTRLRPKYWEKTLSEIYKFNAVESGYQTHDIQGKLHPVEKRRKNLLRILHTLRRLTYIPGDRLGRLIWKSMLFMMISASRLRYRN